MTCFNTSVEYVNYFCPNSMNVQNFYLAGINYKKSDTAMRGEYAVSADTYISILHNASQHHISELFVLSTCNRTEIYGMAASSSELINVLCSETGGTAEDFLQHAYIKKGWEAVEHLFHVGAGLDSQILGDYEIIGQIKQAVKIAKQHNAAGGFIERLVNTVLQSSKSIKAQTELSSGTVSVAFAAVQCIKENLAEIRCKKIVLLGTGKIGANTCRNLVDYLHTTNITLINRTEEKAGELAAELNIQYASFDELDVLAKEADAIIVATNAEKCLVNASMINNCGSKLLIDLSIPNNIDVDVVSLPGITLMNVDDLSKINDATLQKRQSEIPKAKGIIVNHIHEFAEWCSSRRYAPALKAAKQKLLDMQQCPMFLSSNINREELSDASGNMQKVINSMAVKMRTHHQPGCNYIEAINDFISAHAV